MANIAKVNGVGISAGSSIAEGKYTGDGATSLAISGLGFAPKMVFITQISFSGTTETHVAMDSSVEDVGDGHSWRMSDGQIYDNRIIALGTDGFTVDDDNSDAHPNKNSQVYNYVAWG
jgi:hypothetical protein